MIDAVDLRPGTIFEEDGSLFKVLRFQQHRMSQAASVCRTKLKNMKTGAVAEKSYRATDKIKNLETERRLKTYMYADAENANFMDMENYETVTFPLTKLGPAIKFLTENMEIEALYVGGQLLDIVLPSSVSLKVASAPPGIRGDSATNPSKPVTLENGMTVQTPVFIKEGDIIKVNPETAEYVERVSS